MDYEGQRLAELIFYWIILSFGAVGWVIGYFKQDFMVVFQLWLVGVVISVVVRTKVILLNTRALQTVILIDCNSFRVVQLCVPDWPFYNRHPVKWLDSVPDRRGQK
jgi:signal peptidase complex subunit 1